MDKSVLVGCTTPPPKTAESKTLGLEGFGLGLGSGFGLGGGRAENNCRQIAPPPAPEISSHPLWDLPCPREFSWVLYEFLWILIANENVAILFPFGWQWWSLGGDVLAWPKKNAQKQTKSERKGTKITTMQKLPKNMHKMHKMAPFEEIKWNLQLCWQFTVDQFFELFKISNFPVKNPVWSSFWSSSGNGGWGSGGGGGASWGSELT